MVKSVKVGDVIMWTDARPHYRVLEILFAKGYDAFLTLINVSPEDSEYNVIYKNHPTNYRDLTLIKAAKKRRFL